MGGGRRPVGGGVDRATDRVGPGRTSVSAAARCGVGAAPGRRRAGAAGRLSAEHLRAIGECAHRYPTLAAEHDEAWCEQADALNAESFRVAARHWLEAAADAAEPDPATAPSGSDAEVSRLHISRTFEGWLRIDGLFAPHDADLVEAVLDAGVDRALRDAHDGDPSVAGQPVSALRAAALVDLAAQAMRREPSDASAPDRYRVAVVVQPGQPTVPAEAACDAGAYRVVLGADREVLDVGRQTNRWTAGIRRAITIRDRGCVFPGCDRPPSWTDIHHCTPWSEGGTTSVDNGVLLCRRHHTFIHRERWRITIENGRPIIRRPDGSIHTIQRWPALDTAS